MKDAKINAIEARANAADAGPWVNSNATQYVGTGQIGADGGVYDFHGYLIPEANNREFIAHARQDILALVSEVRRLRELVRSAQWEGTGADEPYTACPWCRVPYEFHPPNQQPHRDSCTAFTPDGSVK